MKRISMTQTEQNDWQESDCYQTESEFYEDQEPTPEELFLVMTWFSAILLAVLGLATGAGYGISEVVKFLICH